MRGSNEEGPSAVHSILHTTQQANLPTKNNYPGLQGNKTTSGSLPGQSKISNDKNENLRSQLRRSYDANAGGNLPHANGM